MSLLSEELTKHLLNEEETSNPEIIGMFGGGFKPPTKGHLKVVEDALVKYPEMDKLIILVGSGERDSISQRESLAIWEIYKNYLPNKVEIIPSPQNKPPIGVIYSYAKNHLDKEIYWILGAREGDEGDVEDILQRTKSLSSGKYSNLEVKQITTRGDAVSGTKARNALLSRNKEEFITYFPNIPEIDEIWNMLISINESNFISQDDVGFVDNMADNKLSPIDIDLTSTHFFSRLNDPRNAPNISVDELESFFDKLSDEKETFIDFIKKYKDIVVKDSETNINIPFMKIANRAIAKTVMRKKNFQTSNKVLPLDEDISKDVLNSFDIQDTLVKDVWVDNKLKPEIREKLLIIAQDFFDSLELPEGTILRDIKLTGSLANFNWSKFSDVDLHLVLDFSEIADNEEFAKDYFMAKKNLWNNAHDVDIFGYPVEVYVEDKDEPHTASGLYSILNDEWITIPQQQKIVIDKDDISSKAEGYLSIIPQLEVMFEKEEYENLIRKIDKIKERIRNMRSSGLEKGGLYSVENLAFKVLRRSNYVEKLNDLKIKSYDALMSLNEELTQQVPDVLYHATYKALLPLIKKGGLDTRKSALAWEDSKPGIVYLANDPYVAESYAEAAEEVSDEIYDSGIIILNIPIKGLDISKLHDDRNVQEDDSDTYEYHGQIPWEKINYFESLNEKLTKSSNKENITLPVDQKIVLQADTEEHTRGLVVKWRSDGGYDVAYWYGEPNNIVPAELVGDGKSFGDIKNVWLGYHPTLDNKKKINENATYSQTINVKEKIAALMDHMIEKGMNIEPLPTVEFVDGDTENAKNFFGKTAYYDPNEQHIVVYTEGRHPKDIVRSFSHEMIHHIQNLEDRLGDVSTTNTMEDDNIDKLEQEANLRGTMTFRNWTDSLNEGKDPFCLNSYIYKLFEDLEKPNEKRKNGKK